MMKILIITGGSSSERRISLMSAKEVKKALQLKGHRVRLFDLKRGKGRLEELASKFDVLFPVLHGEEGEGGELQKFLKSLKKPFVGGDWRGFKKAWYKISFKEYCDKNGITTSPWKIISKGSMAKAQNEILRFGFPGVLKTSNGGSSREVMILKSVKDLETTQFKRLFNLGSPLLIERYLAGVEVTAAILKDKALPLIEIQPKTGWFDYKTKYWGQVEEIPHAPSLNKSLQKQIQKTALRIHQDHNLGYYCRIDFIVHQDIPHALEVNTIPGLTASSLFPKAGMAEGLEFTDLMEYLIILAIS